jgi:hypothetical protein
MTAAQARSNWCELFDSLHPAIGVLANSVWLVGHPEASGKAQGLKIASDIGG